MSFTLKYSSEILLAIFILLMNGCMKPTEGSLEYYLQKAGVNSNEIKETYDYFLVKNDSLQMGALLFLLQNMAQHNYSEITLQDSNRNEVYFSIHDFPDYDSARNQLDSLDSVYGDLNWRLNRSHNDLETITSDLLINNIELAFDVWRNKPWSHEYSFSQLKEYILPYRGSNEPLNEWRKYFRDRFDYLSTEFSNSDDLLKVASAINESLKTSFGFDPKYYLNPTDQGLAEMLKNGQGRCEDMANLTIYAFRANGIAISSDYTPYWADSGNNHAWNAMILPDGSSIPFMGCEANPGSYNLRARIAKVYRKMYARQKNPLLNADLRAEDIPPWLGSSNYIDVTEYYVNVNDVDMVFEKKLLEDAEFAYLCVFNSGEWKPIQYAKVENNTANFTGMGSDLCYLPALFKNKKVIPLASPFILTESNEIIKINGSKAFNDLTLISVTQRVVKNSTDNKTLSFLTKEEYYLLYYWDDKWILSEEKKAEQGPMLFTNVPSNRLYWLVKKDSSREERIFTYQNGTQIWW